MKTSQPHESNASPSRNRAGSGRVPSGGRPQDGLPNFRSSIFLRFLVSPLQFLSSFSAMSSGSHSDDGEEDPVWEGSESIWQAWEPECDACGRPESSLERPKDQLLTCAGCLVAKYCSVRSELLHPVVCTCLTCLPQKQCQKKDWSNSHKGQCHLYEANRKLSSVFAKSLGPGYVWINLRPPLFDVPIV